MEFFNPIEHRSEIDFVKVSPNGYGHLYNSEEVYPFWIADMDFKVAKPIRSAIHDMADRGVFAYEYNNNKLYGAISSWFQRRHDLYLNPNNYVQVNGVLTGIALLLRLFSDKRDGVIINSPVYHMFSHTIRANRRKVVDNPLKFDENRRFSFDFEQLDEQMAKPENKIFLLCNPHNPVGRVWTRDELEQIKSLSQKHGVLVISDEVHADILYDNHKFISYADVDREGSIVLLGSPAKTFGMQSVATGHIYTEHASYLRKIRSEAEALFIHHGNAITYYMTLAAYNAGDLWVNELIEYLQETINSVKELLSNHLPLVKISPLEGTYQMWMDFSGMNLTEEELENWIFNQAKMGLAPGKQFGEQYESWFRLNFATDRAVILTYLNRLIESKPLT
ncbi:MAG: MalY/PatB family protein [Flavobacteriaceae bacterium]